MNPYRNGNHSGSPAINGANGSPPNGVSTNGIASMQSTYGYYHFNENQHANEYINRVLNTERGFVGGVAGVLQLGPAGRRLPGNPNRLFPASGSTGSVSTPQIGSSTPSAYGQGRRFSGMAVRPVRDIPLHGAPPPDPRLGTMNAPRPSSDLFLFAHVDTPVNSTSNRGNRSVTRFSPGRTPPPSPAPSSLSTVSVCSYRSSNSSRSSISSISSSPCMCDNCRPTNCVCYMYCAHHAAQNCPVHGDGGINSSNDESAYGSQSSSSFSFFTDIEY